MKTTEEVFSDMLDAVAICIRIRMNADEFEDDRRMDGAALNAVREFFVPFVADVARHAVT